MLCSVPTPGLHLYGGAAAAGGLMARRCHTQCDGGWAGGEGEVLQRLSTISSKAASSSSNIEARFC